MEQDTRAHEYRLNLRSRAEKRSLLLDVINEDCLIRGKYRDEDGKTCAIGHMAVVAGIPLPKSNAQSIRRLQDLADQLCEFYGLTFSQLWNIQLINDEYGTVERRRAAITDYITRVYEV